MGVRSRPHSASLMFALVWALPGCEQAGGQTGDGADFSEPQLPQASDVLEALDCNNEQRAIEAEDEEVPELGFSASDVLTLVEGTHSTSLGWVLHPTFAEEEPEDDGIRIEVRYEDGPIVLHTFNPDLVRPVEEPKLEQGDAPALPAPDEPQAGEPSEPRPPDVATTGAADSNALEHQCPPSLDIEVVVRVQSSDGALDEEFTTELRALSPSVASFSHQLGRADFDGSLELSTSAGEIAGYQIDTTFVEYGITGRLDALATAAGLESVTPGDAGTAENDGRSEAIPMYGAQYSVAVWPDADDCAEAPYGGQAQGIVVGPETQLRYHELDEALDAFSEVGTLPLTWRDQQTTQLTVDVQPQGVACVMPSDDNEHVFYAATLRAQTTDARLDATYAAYVSVNRASKGSYAMLDVALTDVDAADAISLFGMRELEVSGHEKLDLSMWLSTSSESNDQFSGVLDVRANAECEDPVVQDREDESVAQICPVGVENATIGALGESFEEVTVAD